MHPGSDVEEETGSCNVAANLEPILRDSDNLRALSITIADSDSGNGSELSGISFIYEIIMALWLRSFLDQVENENSQDDFEDSTGEGSPSIKHSALFVALSEDSANSASAPFFLFHSQMDFLLPLCLKSFLLRCTSALPDSSPAGRIMLDRGHMQILVPFVEMLTHSLVGEALACSDSDGEPDLTLLRALSTAQLVLDFLVGLSSVLHAQHTAMLLHEHFRILRECEIPDQSASFVWNRDTLRRVRCSRQLRLRSVERLACMPNFVAINYPLKYGDDTHNQTRQSTSWCTQSNGYEVEGHVTASICPYPDGRDRLPESGWLASLLAGESLSMASLTCEAVVAEAMAHVESTSPRGRPSKGSNVSSASERPGASLSRDDLLMLQSVSIHAITCVYELLLRRHAMDSRFQKEQARSRIAALFAPVILEKSLRSTRWLARMEATHKARSTWLLCFIYIMQEAPESQLRDSIRSYCFPPVNISCPS